MRRRILAVAVVAVAGLAGGCSESSASLPPEMIGTWTTDNSRYAERFIKVEGSHVSFGTGGGLATRHPIVFVREEPGPHGRLFTIEYQETSEATGKFGVYLDQTDGTVLRLENQPGFAWTRDGA